MEKLRNQIPEGYKTYDATQRVKVALPNVAQPEQAIQSVNQAWQVADRVGYTTPLVQIRAIMPVEDEEFLLSSLEDARQGIVVNGRIPFLDPITGTEMSIYYLQKEDPLRKGFIFHDPNKDITHNEAVERARHAGSKMYENHQGYELIRLSPGGEILDNGKQFDIEELAEKLVASHKACFAYPHDPNQQTVQGMIEILMNNPNVTALTSTGEIAAVGVMEKDESFAQITQVNIYEPTFWTVPDHRRNGLSTGLRQAMMRLSDSMGNTLFYSESIRPTSFITSQRAGCKLAGTKDLTVSGDLGNSYTAIGPATPETGFMPMGLTYYASGDIRIE